MRLRLEILIRIHRVKVKILIYKNNIFLGENVQQSAINNNNLNKNNNVYQYQYQYTNSSHNNFETRQMYIGPKAGTLNNKNINSNNNNCNVNNQQQSKIYFFTLKF
jgi:hypothetical protein